MPTNLDLKELRARRPDVNGMVPVSVTEWRALLDRLAEGEAIIDAEYERYSALASARSRAYRAKYLKESSDV